jgi:hypothetical protein
MLKDKWALVTGPAIESRIAAIAETGNLPLETVTRDYLASRQPSKRFVRDNAIELRRKQRRESQRCPAAVVSG